MKLDYLAEEIEAQHASTLKNRALAITGLRLLVGAQPGEELPIAQQEVPAAPTPPDGDQILRRALEQRPETRAATEAVGARKAQVDLARAQLWPDFGLVGGVNFTTTTNADSPISPFVSNSEAASGYIALGLRGTFDVPQKLARVRQAVADLHEAAAMQLGAQQLVRLDIQQAIGDLTEARVRVERYTRETEIGKQLATQAGVAFDTGLGEAREFLEDTLLYTRANGERMRALYDAQLAWAALEKAAGGPLSPCPGLEYRFRGASNREEAFVTSIAVALIVAAIQAGSASEAVERTQEKVRASLTAWIKSEGPARTRAREQARKAVDELIDFDALAKATLGNKWDQLKPADRKRYTAALRGAMEANYLARMRKGKASDVERIRTEITGEEPQDGKVVVHTRVHTGEDTATIDYLMVKGPKGWRAVDVITEGVSLADTYREQVARILAKKTLNDVIAALDRKRKALEAELDKPPSAEEPPK